MHSPMRIQNVSHLGLRTRGEVIVEVDWEAQQVTSLFRGCLPNLWDLDDLEPDVQRVLRSLPGSPNMEESACESGM